MGGTSINTRRPGRSVFPAALGPQEGVGVGVAGQGVGVEGDAQAGALGDGEHPVGVQFPGLGGDVVDVCRAGDVARARNLVRAGQGV
jgi:hypothetical protein